MIPFLKIATDLVEECLKDSKVTSAVKMRLAGLIAEKLCEQYTAGMWMAARLCMKNRNEYAEKPNMQNPYDRGYWVGCNQCYEDTSAGAEKEERNERM